MKFTIRRGAVFSAPSYRRRLRIKAAIDNSPAPTSKSDAGSGTCTAARVAKYSRGASLFKFQSSGESPAEVACASAPTRKTTTASPTQNDRIRERNTRLLKVHSLAWEQRRYVSRARPTIVRAKKVFVFVVETLKAPALEAIGPVEELTESFNVLELSQKTVTGQ
jgi:hypothetical protein